MKWSVLFLLVLSLVGCKQTEGLFSAIEQELPTSLDGDRNPPLPTPAPPSNGTEPAKDEVLSGHWENYSTDGRYWSKFVSDQIKENFEDLTDTVPADIDNYCSNYPQLDRKQRINFWMHLLSTMAYFESGHDPSTSYQESFNDGSGNPVISRGLLQLSYESSLGYGCPISIGEDLHDPSINLHCALRILTRWVVYDGVISRNEVGGWKGGARYWSVLRKVSTHEPIQNWNQDLEICSVD